MFGKLPRTPIHFYFQPIPLVSKSLLTPLLVYSLGCSFVSCNLAICVRRCLLYFFPAFLFSVGTLSKTCIFPHCRKLKPSLSLLLHLSDPVSYPFFHLIETVFVKNKTFSMLAYLSDTFFFCTQFIQFNFLLNSFNTIDSSLYLHIFSFLCCYELQQPLNSLTISLDSFSQPHSLAPSLVLMPECQGSRVQC